MVYIDTTKPDRELTPGVDLWEIREAANKKSRSSGAAMIGLKLVRVSAPTEHLYDNIMLEGPGWPIGKRKLEALIPAGFKGDVDPIDWIGVRLWAETVIKQGDKGDMLAVNIDGLKHAGYQRAEDVPPGCAAPAEVTFPDETTPF